jgi:inner membrane protein
MDNLTHSLVGALIGQMGLKRKTGLAMPTLIVAANIPDIDAVAVLLGGHQHLAIRRGITHGPIAMVVLPLLLWAAMLAYAKWRPNPDRPPIHKSWLLTLAFIGCLSHPLFDWFNSYGVRLLEPFSSQWFYGDTLFIVDIWIWIALVVGVWVSLRRERRGRASWQRPAKAAFASICAYILANGAITGHAEALAAKSLKAQLPSVEGKLDVVANPWPIIFICRDILWRDAASSGRADYCLGQGLRPEKFDLSHAHFMGNLKNDSLVQSALARDPDLRHFLFWSRMPEMRVVDEEHGRILEFSDQRFDTQFVRDRFTVKVPTAK